MKIVDVLDLLSISQSKLGSPIPLPFRIELENWFNMALYSSVTLNNFGETLLKEDFTPQFFILTSVAQVETAACRNNKSSSESIKSPTKQLISRFNTTNKTVNSSVAQVFSVWFCLKRLFDD